MTVGVNCGEGVLDAHLGLKVPQKLTGDLEGQGLVVKTREVKREGWEAQATAQGDGKNRGCCLSKAVERYKHGK